MKIQHTRQWFLNRIGKRIYRLTYLNCCKHCQDVYENGLFIYDRQHAIYIYDCQNEMGLEYADRKPTPSK